MLTYLRQKDAEAGLSYLVDSGYCGTDPQSIKTKVEGIVAGPTRPCAPH